MNKFALVGKDITHSRSPEIYRKLISPSIEYDLLDYKNASDIPSAKSLLEIYDGINITSPYKKHFIDEIKLTKSASLIGAVNCLKKSGNGILGENTDYLAVVDILKELQMKYSNLDVIILGDGVMSKVAKTALEHLNIECQLFSRKIIPDLTILNLEKYFSAEKGIPLLINTCAREYVFAGSLPKNSVVWDFNYNFPQHSQYFFNKVQNYFDGLEVLERQAFYAVSFWSKSHPA